MLMLHRGLFACAALVGLVGAAFDPRNQWRKVDEKGKVTTFLGDPSPGLQQRSCYSYFGQTSERDGKEWASAKCNAPFDQVCMAIKGEAELKPYEFTTSYIRGCHFRCPCPDAQPWVEWYHSDAYGGEEWRFTGSIRRHWEKICFLQHPPKGYAVGSNALPFSMAKGLNVRCCKKHWNWIGHPNDTKKHPVIKMRKFVEDYNRSALARIGYWGKENPLAQPPEFLDDLNVQEGAENCNMWPTSDPMVPLDEIPKEVIRINPVMKTICSHMDDCNSYSAGQRAAPPGWVLLVAALLAVSWAVSQHAH